jgi:hypothetical protein
MGSDEPADAPRIADIKRRQREEELAEREQLADADIGADAERHRRRADKARYLREKLEERERADQEAAKDDD